MLTDRNGRQATGADGLAERQKLETKLTSGRSLPNTSSWVRDDRERGLMVHHCYHVVDALQCSAVGARLRTSVAQRESLHTSQGLLVYAEWINLFGHAPAPCYAILPRFLQLGQR